MMIQNEDGTCTGGPLDVLCVLHDTANGTFHAAFFEEKPLPGPVKSVEETDAVRLKSKMHHTDGNPTKEEALGVLADLSTKIKIPPENIWTDPIPWDGTVGIVWLIPNWRKAS